MTGRPKGTVSQTLWMGRCSGSCGDILGVLSGGGERPLLPGGKRRLLVMLTLLRKRRMKVMVRMDLEEGCVPSLEHYVISKARNNVTLTRAIYEALAIAIEFIGMKIYNCLI